MISYTDLVDDIEAILQDSTNTYFEAALIGQYLIKSLREVARYVPHIIVVPYEIESRTGSATSTSANNLVDATNDQFAAADVGKRVYNTTDKTWATISSYSDAETVGLTKDIFASGESYKIFNEDCENECQINIEDMVALNDYQGVLRVEYPIGSPRNFTLKGSNNEILEIDYGKMPDSSEANSDTTIHVYFKKRHKLSQLTDFAGAVNNASGYSAGDTSMAVNGLQSTGTIEEGQEFTLPYSSRVYTVISAATITTNAATISFYPGLERDVANSTVVTFIQSTLNADLEMIIQELVAGEMLVSESHLVVQQIQAAISAIADANTNVDSAVTAIAAANDLRNTVTIGRGLSDYTNQANAYLNASAGFIREVNARMNSAVERMEATGRRKVEEAKKSLNRLVGSKSSQVYSRG